MGKKYTLHPSLCQRLGFVLFTDKAASTKHEPRNERFSAIRFAEATLVPSEKWLQVAFNGIIQIYGL